MTVSCVPDDTGTLELSNALPDAWQGWINSALAEFPSLGETEVQRSAIGYRCLDLSDEYKAGPIYKFGGRLDLDGSGFLLFGLRGDEVRDVPSGSWALMDSHLVANLIWLYAIERGGCALSRAVR